MDQEVRAWDVFTGLDSTVKNMITAFRVIGEFSCQRQALAQVTQLNNLIIALFSELTPGDRQKIMTIYTIHVHARDGGYALVAQKTESQNSFMWAKQLRDRWAEKDGHCYRVVLQKCHEKGRKQLKKG